jgi:hypothetical protein
MNGWLRKQVPGYFINWKRVFGVLENKKLMLFTNESCNKLEICVNFETLISHLHHGNTKEQKKGSFSFTIETIPVS